MSRDTRSRALLVAAAALAAAAGACNARTSDDSDLLIPPVPCSAATAKATTSILISKQFLPYCATVGVGVPLTFTNADNVNHTATADAGQPEPFDSGLLVPGQQYVHAFSAPETVHVHDRLNPEISAIVIVQ